MIIDFHTHIFPEKISAKGVDYIGHFYGFDLDTSHGTKADLDAECAKAGVDYKVMLSVAVRPEQVSSINNWLSTQIDDHSFGFGTLHPDMEDPVSELARFSELGLRGVKYHPDMQEFAIDDPKMYKIYEQIEGRYPVIFHAGDKRYNYSGAKKIAKILDDFPNMTLVAAHLGGYSEWEDAERYLAGRDVYYDTSSAIAFLPKERAKQIILGHRCDRILFATDYPCNTQTNELEILRSLDLGEELTEKILRENGAQLLGIK